MQIVLSWEQQQWMHANENGARAPIRRKKTHVSIGMKNKTQNYNDTEKIVGKERKKNDLKQEVCWRHGNKSQLETGLFSFLSFMYTRVCSLWRIFEKYSTCRRLKVQSHTIFYRFNGPTQKDGLTLQCLTLQFPWNWESHLKFAFDFRVWKYAIFLNLLEIILSTF